MKTTGASISFPGRTAASASKNFDATRKTQADGRQHILFPAAFIYRQRKPWKLLSIQCRG